MARVVGRGRVGRIGDQGIDRVGHDMAQHRELVHMHPLLIQTGDVGLGDQTGGRDHGSRHTIANEQDNILGLALLGDGIDIPNQLGSLLIARSLILVLEEDFIGTGFTELDVAPGGRGDIDGC